jgi:hypothetical protein
VAPEGGPAFGESMEIEDLPEESKKGVNP